MSAKGTKDEVKMLKWAKLEVGDLVCSKAFYLKTAHAEGDGGTEPAQDATES